MTPLFHEISQFIAGAVLGAMLVSTLRLGRLIFKPDLRHDAWKNALAQAALTLAACAVLAVNR